MKPIPNFDGYFADKQGNIYSSYLRGAKGKVLTTPWLMQSTSDKRDGRKFINLSKNGNHHVLSVAAFLLETFVSPRPKGMFACHGLRGCGDDSLDNIYWGTPSRNAQDRKRDGTNACGETHGMAKLNTFQVRIAIRFYQMTEEKYGSQTYLATIFNCESATISYIVNNQTWKHIPRPI